MLIDRMHDIALSKAKSDISHISCDANFGEIFSSFFSGATY